MWLVLVKEKTLCGVCNGINKNLYVDGIQKSFKFFQIKLFRIQWAIQNFWHMFGMQAKKCQIKSYTDFLCCCDHVNSTPSSQMAYIGIG